MHIKVTRGLDIPMKGLPEQSGRVESLAAADELALNLHPFDGVKFKLKAKAGDRVKRGQALAHDKQFEKRVFVAPAAGKIKEVRRGLKRRLLNIVIEVEKSEEDVDHGKLDPATASREQILEHLLKGGAFAHIRQRPYNVLAQPDREPRDIFVRAVESAPCVPSAELQVEGHEKDFQTGLTTLSKLTSGAVHLVHRLGSSCKAFTEAQEVQAHTVEGPHPSSNASVHLYHVAPVQSVEEAVWTVNVVDVITIGHLMNTGHYFTDRIIGIGGPGVTAERRGLFKGRMGHPVGGLIAGRNTKGLLRLISGDVLMGEKVEVEDFLHFGHSALTVIPENVEREFMHFFRLGMDKFSIHKAYLSGHLAPGSKTFDFTTTQHGEARGIADGSIYEKVLPMDIPVLSLLRAVQAKDFDLADQLGFLELDTEDFALPELICPSKTAFTDVIRQALQKQALENVH